MNMAEVWMYWTVQYFVLSNATVYCHRRNCGYSSKLRKVIVNITKEKSGPSTRTNILGTPALIVQNFAVHLRIFVCWIDGCTSKYPFWEELRSSEVCEEDLHATLSKIFEMSIARIIQSPWEFQDLHQLWLIDVRSPNILRCSSWSSTSSLCRYLKEKILACSSMFMFWRKKLKPFWEILWKRMQLLKSSFTMTWFFLLWYYSILLPLETQIYFCIINKGPLLWLVH